MAQTFKHIYIYIYIHILYNIIFRNPMFLCHKSMTKFIQNWWKRQGTEETTMDNQKIRLKWQNIKLGKGKFIHILFLANFPADFRVICIFWWYSIKNKRVRGLVLIFMEHRSEQEAIQSMFLPILFFSFYCLASLQAISKVCHSYYM